MVKNKIDSTTESEEVIEPYVSECIHDWHNMSDEGWKRCRKCGLAINYEGDA